MAEFKHGLFGCFDNVGLCVKAYFCPCVIFGQTAEVMGESCVTCGVCLVIGGPVAIYAMAKVRGLVREKSGIEGSLLNDVLMSWCCSLCTIVQNAQEIELAGTMPGQSAMARY